MSSGGFYRRVVACQIYLTSAPNFSVLFELVSSLPHQQIQDTWNNVEFVYRVMVIPVIKRSWIFQPIHRRSLHLSRVLPVSYGNKQQGISSTIKPVGMKETGVGREGERHVPVSYRVVMEMDLSRRREYHHFLFIGYRDIHAS